MKNLIARLAQWFKLLLGRETAEEVVRLNDRIDRLEAAILLMLEVDVEVDLIEPEEKYEYGPLGEMYQIKANDELITLRE